MSNGFITGINLYLSSKLKFCEACTKAKSAHQPFPKESLTWAIKYGEQVHWDLWGPASIKSINGHYYVAALIDNATWEMMLYFQEKKSKTLKSYKRMKCWLKPNWQPYQNNAQWLRGRIPIKRVNETPWWKRNDLRNYSSWLPTAKQKSQKRHVYTCQTSPSSAAHIRTAKVLVGWSYETHYLASKQNSSTHS